MASLDSSRVTRSKARKRQIAVLSDTSTENSQPKKKEARTENLSSTTAENSNAQSTEQHVEIKIIVLDPSSTSSPEDGRPMKTELQTETIEADSLTALTEDVGLQKEEPQLEPATEKPSCSSNSESLSPDCPICLDSCTFPVQLPCLHVFCFLCIKGVALSTDQCPLCRRDIPKGFLNKPVLVKQVEKKELAKRDDRFQWFYKGRNGWWQFDCSTGSQLESSYQNGDECISVSIAGASYSIDFKRMVQFPTTRPGRTRQIKRDVSAAPKLGVAGLQLY